MTASLPMYWRPETADAWRAFWAVVQFLCVSHLPDLTHPDDLPENWVDHWLSPDLTLSMTCGLPFRTALKGRVSYVGTLSFDIPCPPGHYFSRVIQSKNSADQPPHRLAFNAPDSQSGWAAVSDVSPQNPQADFTDFVRTGSHAASLAAVAEGRADMAWIDAVTWRLLRRHDDNARQVTVVGRSAPTPGLPLITALGRDPDPLRAALFDAVATLPPDLRAELGGITGFHVLDEADYFALPVPQPPPA